MLNHKKLSLLRRVQRVQRLHTLPTTYNQSVGEHTFGVMTLLELVLPDAPLIMWRAVFYHDATEALTGDIPATTKWKFPVLEDALKDAEQRIAKEYDFDIALSGMQKKIIKFCDIMELEMFAREQVAAGDRRMRVVQEKCLNAIKLRGLVDVTPNAKELFELEHIMFENGVCDSVEIE